MRLGRALYCQVLVLLNPMPPVSSNVSLEPYDGSPSQKSYNNVRRILSMDNFHCKTIRNAANITANFEKSRSKSVILGHKSEKSVLITD